MPMPRNVKLAIFLSWAVLILKSINNIYVHIATYQPTADLLFPYLLAGVTLTSIAITALFIFFASRRRNWARTALLIWTLSSWALWLFYPSAIKDYAWWKWLGSITLILSELVALVLLFHGKGGKWYSSEGIE